MSTAPLRHEVPACYLRRFACPRAGTLEVYDLDRRTAGELPPEQALVSDDDFACLRGDGSASHEIGKLLAQLDAIGEALYDPVLAGHDLAGDERHGFAFFLASIYLRSTGLRRQRPEDLERATDVAGWSHAVLDAGWAAIERMLRTRGELEPAEFATARALLADPERLARRAPGRASLAALGALSRIARAIAEMAWTVTRASGGSFITSDSPMTLGRDGPERSGLAGIGLAAANALLSLPLSPAVCWLGHWGQLQDPRAWRSASAVQELNRRRVEHAARFIMAAPRTHNLAGLARHRRTNVVTLARR